MPVRVRVECLSPSCDVAERCATPDHWIGVTEADFRENWMLELYQVATTPLRSNRGDLCAIAAGDGYVVLTGLRYHRERGDDGAWVMRSMTRDWAFRVVAGDRLRCGFGGGARQRLLVLPDRQEPEALLRRLHLLQGPGRNVETSRCWAFPSSPCTGRKAAPTG